MPKYCDTKELERNWFNWLVAAAVPILEPYRSSGALWTKVIGVVDPERPELRDPTFPRRLHCIALEKRVRLCTVDGKLKRGKPVLKIPFHDQIERFGLPTVENSDLINQGYYKEPPVDESWQALLMDIGKMCEGIAMKFNLNSEGARHDLAADALLQVISKMRRSKLVYIPGRAPVFNLLTTTIHRCMFSILSRDTRQRQNLAKLCDTSNPYTEKASSGHTQVRRNGRASVN